MESKKDEEFYNILRHELIPAFGCTEPGAVSYASAYAASVLGEKPDHMSVWCSVSVFKNVHSVGIPNSEHLKGISAAAILGVLISNPEDALCVLQDVTDDVRQEATRLYDSDFCKVHLAEDQDGLYIRVLVTKEGRSAEVTIVDEHTNIVSVKRNGKTVMSSKGGSGSGTPDKSFLTVQGILDFADRCDISKISDLLEKQISDNTAIAAEGLKGDYGINVGRNLLEESNSADVRIRARAMPAAGSDARMDGCLMPVVINSGSGNQGLTVSLPVVEYAKDLHSSHEKLLRALCVANLVAILQKKTVGNLSAFCGAVHAAAGAASGIVYLMDGGYNEIADVIAYTLGTIGGMICDGAKASCAAKISQAVDTALTGMHLAMKGKHLSEGDGLITKDIETTIENYGKVGRDGMSETNKVVLELMLTKS